MRNKDTCVCCGKEKPLIYPHKDELGFLRIRDCVVAYTCDDCKRGILRNSGGKVNLFNRLNGINPLPLGGGYRP